MMKKVSLFFVLLIFALGNLGLNAKAANFSDLQESSLFYEEISFLEAEGIITGYSDGTFRPQAEVTRSAVAIMIGKTLNLDGTQRETSFSDVDASQPASGYIASAVEAGIIQGFTDGTYRPGKTVTRGEMAIFLSRAFHLTEEAATSFTDISPSMVSYPYIKRIIAEKLTTGYGDHTFRPNQKVTRGQFSAFLARALHDEFKVEIAPVYTMDPNKIYYSHSRTGNGFYTYLYHGDDWNYWYVYRDNGESYELVEAQDSEGYKVGWPDSEYSLVIANPIVTGHTWDAFVDDIRTITATNLTITTPAGTFNQVVEVMSEGVSLYYAPNAGLVKVMADGQTTYEVVKIADR